MPEPRRYLYIRTARLQEHADQRRSLPFRVTGVGAKVAGTGGDVDVEWKGGRSEIYKEINRLLKRLKKDQQLGTLDAPKTYFHGRLSMYIVPFSDAGALYLTGETEHTMVALGGPLADQEGLAPEDEKTKDSANVIHSEVEVARAVAESLREKYGDEQEQEPLGPREQRWEWNIVEAHRRLTYYPHWFDKREVEVLGWKDRFSEASELAEVLHEPKGVLLGRPVFVAYM